MQINRYAGIDIGSNAARLIIKDLHPTETNQFILKKRVYIRMPLRLGNDVFTSGRISKEKFSDLIKVIDIFKDIMQYNQVIQYRACATSALRNALNQDEVVNHVKLVTGIGIQVIDGFEEAELLYLTNRENLNKGKYYLSADLGGGSLQLALMNSKELIWAHAFKTGTLRYLTQTVDANEIRALNDKLDEIKSLYPNILLLGSGGNINKISKLLLRKRLRYRDLEHLHTNISTLSYSKLIKKYSFREDRADVIIPALEIYMNVLKRSGSAYIFVPKTGLADGIIRSIFLQEHGIKKLKL